MAENIAAYEHRQREEHRQRLLREGGTSMNCSRCRRKTRRRSWTNSPNSSSVWKAVPRRSIRTCLLAQAEGIDPRNPGGDHVPPSGAESYQQQRDLLFGEARRHPDAFSEKQLGKASARCTKCI